MPPKAAIDPTEKKFIYMKVVGGEVTPAAALAPRCAPVGLAPKKVGDDIQKATKDWKGIKIYIEITVQNRAATIDIIPTASPLLIKALKETPRDRKKVKNIVHNGKITMDDVVRIAKQLRERNRSMAGSFTGTVLEILGSAVSIGCSIDGKPPKDVQKSIKRGEMVIEE